MYKDPQVADMLSARDIVIQEKDDKISELEADILVLYKNAAISAKEIVSLNTYIGELENELNNHKALKDYIK